MPTKLKKKVSKKARGSQRKVARKASSKRKAAVGTKPKYQVIHEVRRVGSISSMSDVRHAARMQKKYLHEELAWLLLTRDQAKKKSVKNAISKKITAKRAQIRQIDSLL